MTSVAQYIADGAPVPISKWGWKNSALPAIHMPYAVCRLWLDVTEVRVEKLQSISEDDAEAEGVREYERGAMSPPGEREPFSAAELYRRLWESIHGPESWEADPWVFVLSFTVSSIIASFVSDDRKPKPMLFSAPMVRALLVRKKTQTRRVIAPQPQVDRHGLLRMAGAAGFTAPHCLPNPSSPCRYGAAGDRMWMKRNPKGRR